MDLWAFAVVTFLFATFSGIAWGAIAEALGIQRWIGALLSLTTYAIFLAALNTITPIWRG